MPIWSISVKENFWQLEQYGEQYDKIYQFWSKWSPSHDWCLE